VLVYGDELMKHRLSDQHPLQPIRVKLAVDLIRSTGLIDESHVLHPRHATSEELGLVHSLHYVDLVRKLSDPKQRDQVSPEEVDAAWAEITGAGYRGHLAPWDAFWGMRYAVVHDPDGTPIDLFAPLSG